MITCNSSNLNNIDKATPSNYQLVFPKIPTESTITANNPFVMNIFSAVIPSLSIGIQEMFWQGNKSRYDLSPIEFDPWLVSFVVDSRLANWSLLFNWMSYINNNWNKIAEEHSKYAVDVSMIITDNYNNSIMELIFVDIWPSTLGEISFSQREGDVVLESTVNFNYDYFYVRDTTTWSDEFSSSSSSKSSSSSSLSSSSSSSSSISSSSSSSSKSSTFVIAGGLSLLDDGVTAQNPLDETPTLVDNNYCTPALSAGATKIEPTNSFGFYFNSAVPLWGYDVWCATPDTPIPQTGIINPRSIGRFRVKYSNNGSTWSDWNTYGDNGYQPATPVIYDTIPLLGTNEEGLFGFRIFAPEETVNAQYYKIVCAKSMTSSGANGSTSELYPSEIKVMEGPSGPSENRWWLPSENINDAIISNYGRTLKFLTTGGLINSKWINPPSKWYWEWQIAPYGSFNYIYSGFQTYYGNLIPNGVDGSSIFFDDTGIIRIKDGGGSFVTGWTWNTSDVFMIAVDVVAQKWWWGKNGTWYASGDPSTGTNPMLRESGSQFMARNGAISAISWGWGGQITSRFKESEQTYNIPTGFQAPVMEDYPTAKGCSVSSSSSSSSSESSSSLSSSSSTADIVAAYSVGFDSTPLVGPSTNTIESGLIDGNYTNTVDTFWQNTKAYMIDMGSSVTLDEIVVRFYVSSGTPTSWISGNREVGLYISDDDATYTFVEEQAGPTLFDGTPNYGAFRFTFSSPQTARYFKLRNNCGSNLATNAGVLEITEMEIK